MTTTHNGVGVGVGVGITGVNVAVAVAVGVNVDVGVAVAVAVEVAVGVGVASGYRRRVADCASPAPLLFIQLTACTSPVRGFDIMKKADPPASVTAVP